MPGRLQALLAFISIFLFTGCMTYKQPTWQQAAKAPPATQQELELWESQYNQITQVMKEGSAIEQMNRLVRSATANVPAKTQARIESARDHVLAHPACASCIYWDEVLREVRSLRPSRMLAVINSAIVAAYAFSADAYIIDVTDVDTMNDEALAGVLAHEATHRVVWRRIMAETGWDREQVAAMLWGCTDVAKRLHLAQEGIAYWNHSSWATQRYRDLHPGMELTDRPSWLEAMGTYELGSLHIGWIPGRQALAASLQRSRIAFAERLVARTSSGAGLTCGPPLLVKGSHRGGYFDPTSLAPRVLTPLFADVFPGP